MGYENHWLELWNFIIFEIKPTKVLKFNMNVICNVFKDIFPVNNKKKPLKNFLNIVNNKIQIS